MQANHITILCVCVCVVLFIFNFVHCLTDLADAELTADL